MCEPLKSPVQRWLGTLTFKLPTAKISAKLTSLELTAKWPTFLGFQITSLYDFFMIFVGLSAVASLILFVLYKKLNTMMAEPVAA